MVPPLNGEEHMQTEGNFNEQDKKKFARNDEYLEGGSGPGIVEPGYSLINCYEAATYLSGDND